MQNYCFTSFVSFVSKNISIKFVISCYDRYKYTSEIR